MSNIRNSNSTRLPSGRVLQLAAVIAILGLIAGFAITSTGFDVKNVKLTNHNIWILKKTGTPTNAHYAKVNTQVNELGSQHPVNTPTEIIQGATGSLLFNNKSAFLNISSSNPQAFDDTTEEAITLDAAPLSVDVGQYVSAVVDESGSLGVSQTSDGLFGKPIVVSPPKDSKNLKFSAAIIGMNEKVLAVSAADSKIREYDPDLEEWTDREITFSNIGAGPFQLAEIGGKVVLLNSTESKLWIEGNADPISVSVGSQLQRNGMGSTIYVAASASMQVIDPGERVGTSIPVPGGLQTARPIEFAGVVYGAWLAEDKGWFYASNTAQPKELNFNGKKLDGKVLADTQNHDLVLTQNGESAVINDTYSGWAWNLPNGDLISGSQDWDGASPPPDPCQENCPPPSYPVPPQAVADSFGVRAGQLISLPVLLNDSDTNAGDVLTVIPESLRGLSSNFGEIRVSSSQQMVTVMVSPNARGTASFNYKINDGTTAGPSNSAKVTLKVVADNKNSAPGWCKDIVSTCVQTWPTASVAPGSEVTIPFLENWLDPEGDRFFISKAELSAGEGNIGFNSSGDLVFQHENAGESKSSVVTAKVTVSDVRGDSIVKTMSINVRADAKMSFNAPVIVAGLNQPLTINFADYVNGADGLVSINSLAARSKTDSLKIEQIDSTKIQITASQAKASILDLTLKDSSGAQVQAAVRVNIVDTDALKLSTSPVTVLISPGLDSSVNLFTAAHNPANRALVISEIRTQQANGGALFADKIKGGFVRFRGTTSDKTSGFVGIVSYKISDGSNDPNYTAVGQAFVYSMPDPEDKSPVSRGDEITVRAGQSAEVDVLANDLGNPGVPLVIDSKSLKQEEKTHCIPGGLIFAGGGKIRIVAPPKSGTYNCDYSIYEIRNPLKSTTASIKIRVTAEGSVNQPPIPVEITTRVRAGETVSIPIPVIGVDPDGDSVTVASISGVKGDKGAAYINPEGTSIEYSSISGTNGQETFSYTLIDSKKAISVAALIRIAIVDSEADTAPTTINDYAEVLTGSENKVTIDPVSNDYDPQPRAERSISLKKDSVVPDAPEGSANYNLWKKALTIRGNQVTITATEEKAVMTFIYSAKSAGGSESIGYITVRVTDDAIDDAPDITDTYVTSSQLDELIGGIDVIKNKIIWASGDTSKLTLSIWGGISGFNVIGNSKLASPTVPEEPGVVIFKLAGTNYSGKQVESYGFLHLPGNNPKITFDPSSSTQEVQEGESKDFDISKLVNLENNVTVGKVKAHGIRESAKCSVKSGNTITYSAGSGAPWSDFCDVQVKVAGSTEPFTTILVPIRVIPNNPEPIINKRQLTIIPGPSGIQSLDLQDMTDFYGRDTGSLEYAFSGGSDYFKITQKGSVLTIEAFGADKPSESRDIKISITNHPKSEPGTLVLVVGQIPNESPVAPALSLSCAVDDDFADCGLSATDLNNGPNAYNPFPETPLVYAPFGYSGGAVSYGANAVNCGGVTLKASPNAISTKWSKSSGQMAAGSKCSVVYQALDREGRVAKGVIEFSFMGVPEAPRSVSQVAYSENTVTLRIVGPKSVSFPALDGYQIRMDDSNETFRCDAEIGESFTLCQVQNLQPWDGKDKAKNHKFSVYAENEVGISNDYRSVSNVYSYRPPKKITSNNIRAVTIVSPLATETKGYAEVTIDPVSDPSIVRYIIEGDAVGSHAEVTPVDLSTKMVTKVTANPGLKSRITVSVVGFVKPPVGNAADTGSSAAWVGRIAAVPKLGTVTAKTIRNGSSYSSKISVASAQRNFSNKALKAAFVLYPGSRVPTCTWDSGLNSITISGVSGALVESQVYGISDQQSENLTSPTISGVQENTAYTPMVCFVNGFGKAVSTGQSISTLSDPAAGVFTYDVNPNPVNGAWLVRLSSSANAAGVFPQFNGSKTDASDWRNDIYSTYYGEDPVIKVRYCKTNSSPLSCSPGTRIVTPSDSSRSWQLKITRIDKLINAETNAEVTSCSPQMFLDFKLIGFGLTKGTNTLWQVAEGSKYSTASGEFDLEKPDERWRIPRRSGSVTKLIMKFQGNSSSATRHVQGLTGTVTLEFTCR